MKAIFILAVSIFILSACCCTAPAAPEEKAKSLIKELFEAPKNYTYGYEAGVFGKIDSSYSTYAGDPEYAKVYDSIHNNLDKLIESFPELMSRQQALIHAKNVEQKKLANKRLDEIIKYRDELSKRMDLPMKMRDSIKENYKPVFNGWKMEHQYKANNSFGFKTDRKDVFYFDPELTKIVKQEDISDLKKDGLP
ncbi:hypothetical protein [Pedobacter punctiformis]|uniref:Uncharacterized protein n=1 Tax=Pedobacter punctiformis TaxID=3004097 RepID=A0ABT4L912_9SPHI|nr:hypothetical protein [Pedobacter sp. HCMS5-2]MCZ4243299.1 hypothetical protein [Pedobacter sp. HCMS5-2]